MEELLLGLLKDKKELLKFVLKTISECDTENNGLTKLQESLIRQNHNHSIENLAKCLAITMKINAKQSNTIKQLLCLALINLSSSDFDGNVAQLLNKLGKGQEAMQQLFKNKLEGN